MKSEFDKWFEKSEYYKQPQPMELYPEDLKKSWNAAINKCWNIVKDYDDDTMLKEALVNNP